MVLIRQYFMDTRVYGDNGYWADMGIHALALEFTISMVIAHVRCRPGTIGGRCAQPPSAMALHHLGLVLRLLGAARGIICLWQTGDLLMLLPVLSLVLCVPGDEYLRSIQALEE